jgi:hypothetical protein
MNVSICPFKKGTTMNDDTEARMARVDESLAKQLQKSIELNAVLAAEIKELKSREPQWVPISVVPTKSGKYLVGHRGLARDHVVLWHRQGVAAPDTAWMAPRQAITT